MLSRKYLTKIKSWKWRWFFSTHILLSFFVCLYTRKDEKWKFSRVPVAINIDFATHTIIWTHCVITSDCPAPLLKDYVFKAVFFFWSGKMQPFGEMATLSSLQISPCAGWNLACLARNSPWPWLKQLWCRLQPSSQTLCGRNCQMGCWAASRWKLCLCGWFHSSRGSIK